MKRELKAWIFETGMVAVLGYRKAHPDEKGTESPYFAVFQINAVPHRKAHPDEKGTESFSPFKHPYFSKKKSQGPSR